MHRFFNKNMIKPHIFLGLLLLHTAHLYAPMTHNQKMVTGCVFFAGIASCLRKPLTKSKIIKKIAQKTNTNAQDIADILPLSMLTWATSYVTTNAQKQRALRYGAIVAPCVMALTTHPTFNKYTSYLFGCTNTKCKGICDECKTGQIYKALPFKVFFGYCSRSMYNAFAACIPAMPTFTRPRPTDTSTDKDKEAARRARDNKIAETTCNICKDEDNNATVAPRCVNCTIIACDGCIFGWLVNNQTCPVCRTPNITGAIIHKPTP